MKIYGDIQSGNCYKVKLVCALLDIDHAWVEVDILGGDDFVGECTTKYQTEVLQLLQVVVFSKV